MTTKEDAIDHYGLIDDDKYEAIRLEHNPTCENVLQYDVATPKKDISECCFSKCRMRREPNHTQTIDSYYTGYERVVPDIMLKCKFEFGFADVVAIELKNLHKKHTL